MPVNYQMDVINPFEAALKGYGAGAQMLQQERTAERQVRQDEQQGQLFGLQMQEAQARLQTLNDERAKAQRAQASVAKAIEAVQNGEFSSELIAETYIASPEFGKFLQAERDRLSTEQKQNLANQNIQIATAIEMNQIPIAKQLYEDMAVAAENSGNPEGAAAARAMAAQLDTPDGPDVVKTTAYMAAGSVLPPQDFNQRYASIQAMKGAPLKEQEAKLNVELIKAQIAAAAAEANGQPKPADRMKAEADLRQEWNRLSAPYKVMQQSISQMRASAAAKNVAGDTALITQFRKLLDPITGVREAEFAQTAEGGGVFRRLENLIAAQTEGQLIADATRDEIVALGNQLMSIADAANRRDREPFEATADTYGLNKRLIFGSTISGEIPKTFPDYPNMTLDELGKVDVFKLNDPEEIRAFNAANARALQKARGGQ